MQNGADQFGGIVLLVESILVLFLERKVNYLLHHSKLSEDGRMRLERDRRNGLNPIILTVQLYDLIAVDIFLVIQILAAGYTRDILGYACLSLMLLLMLLKTHQYFAHINQ